MKDHYEYDVKLFFNHKPKNMKNPLLTRLPEGRESPFVFLCAVYATLAVVSMDLSKDLHWQNSLLLEFLPERRAICRIFR